MRVPALQAQFVPLTVRGEQHPCQGKQPVPQKTPQVMRHRRSSRPRPRGGCTLTSPFQGPRWRSSLASVGNGDDRVCLRGRIVSAVQRRCLQSALTRTQFQRTVTNVHHITALCCRRHADRHGTDPYAFIKTRGSAEVNLSAQHILLGIGLIVLAWAMIQGLVNRGRQRKPVRPRKPSKK